MGKMKDLAQTVLENSHKWESIPMENRKPAPIKVYEVEFADGSTDTVDAQHSTISREDGVLVFYNRNPEDERGTTIAVFLLERVTGYRQLDS